MLVAEGSLYNLQGTFDAAGLSGNVSAQIRWGDGQTTAANVTGGNAKGNLRIRFDYSLDTSGFFASAARRNLLNIVADSIVGRFGDQLTAITPSVSAYHEWQPAVFHPSQGSGLAGPTVNVTKNLSIPANEIVIYVGARDLPGSSRGVGGPGSYSFPSTQISCQTQAQCNQILAGIEAFRDTVRGRGQAGALGSVRSDVAPQIGSISFDNQTDWHFGVTEDGITPGQVDFISVASHELAHVLGFGVQLSNATSSWQRLVSGNSFTGANARAAYKGSGNVPLQSNHWAQSVATLQPTVMSPVISTGERHLFSPLDFAAMRDLGWQVLSTNATVTGSHRFADDGSYPVEVVLSGSRAGELVLPAGSVNVTNVVPSLTVSQSVSVPVGQTLSINKIGELTDPGFANAGADPPTAETFTYTINWGDGSVVDTGTASITANGSFSGALTMASFSGSHIYDTPGNKTVTVTVRDDDNGSAQKTFSVSVEAPPTLILELDSVAIDEDAAAGAAILKVRRSGNPIAGNQTINLSSNDTSEAKVPATAVIPGGSTFVDVPIEAVDDALLDGDITVQLSATANGVVSDTIDLLVRDRESLTATFSLSQIQEGVPGGTVDLTVVRSNVDNGNDLIVNLTASGNPQLNVPPAIMIPGGTDRFTTTIATINDDVAERPEVATILAAAIGYQSGSAGVTVVDDEPPLFQNPNNRFDVDTLNGVRASDALKVIGQLAQNNGPVELDPKTQSPDGEFFDVNGDYRISAVDALGIVNELGRLFLAPASIGSEFLVGSSVPSDDEDVDSDGFQIEVGPNAIRLF